MLSDILSDERATIFYQKRVLRLTNEEYERFRAVSKLLEEHYTAVIGYIRVHQLGEEIIVEEQTDSEDYVIRPMNNRSEVAAFIEERMKAYERMWDSCCAPSIDYDKAFTLELQLDDR